MKTKLKRCQICNKYIKLCPQYYTRKTCGKECGNKLIRKKVENWWIMNKADFSKKLKRKKNVENSTCNNSNIC